MKFELIKKVPIVELAGKRCVVDIGYPGAIMAVNPDAQEFFGIPGLHVVGTGSLKRYTKFDYPNCEITTSDDPISLEGEICHVFARALTNLRNEQTISNRNLAVFINRTVAGLSSKEIAEKFGITANSVDIIDCRVRRIVGEHLPRCFTVPLEIRSDGWLVNMTVGGVEGMRYIDTGTAYSYVHNLSMDFSSAGVADECSLDGGRWTAPMHRVSCEFAGHQFEILCGDARDNKANPGGCAVPNEGVIGFDFFNNFTVVIDRIDGKMAFFENGRMSNRGNHAEES